MDAISLAAVSLDTETALAAALLVVTAYAALWAINKVIGIVKK